MTRADPYRLYLSLEGAVAFLFGMIFTASSIYQITVAGLSPLQLVLVGTTLELAAFIFEIPTGVVADVYSRRLSVVIGYLLIGAGFLLEGSFPLFWTIILAQVVWGLGYTFTSGASQAWISDEIGEASANRAFLRSNQISQVAGLAGIGAGMALGSLAINLPILAGGAALMLVGIGLAFWMPETGFHPTPRGERSSWQSMLHTFQEGVQVVRTRPVLINILTIGLIYGLYSEGFDRLWNKHILDNFTFPAIGDLQPVVWIGLLRASGLLLSVGASEAALRRINTQSTAAIGRSMLAIHALLFAGLVSFALAGQLIWIILAYWAISIARNLIGPLYTAWVNQDLEARVRATVISMSSQVDALGQIAGGPVVGLIGSAVSVRAAILTSASTLLLALPFYARARRYSAQAALPGSSTATESYDANPGREPTD